MIFWKTSFLALGLLVSGLGSQGALASPIASPTKLQAFETDGCSSFMDGPSDHPTLWRHCCVAHDIHYWLGGPREAKTQADKMLLACVNQALGHHDAYKKLSKGTLMYLGVRLGGSAKLNTPWRWGYGWTRSSKPYSTLTEKEKTRGIRKLTKWILWSLEENAAEELDLDEYQLMSVRSRAFDKLHSLQSD